MVMHQYPIRLQYALSLNGGLELAKSMHTLPVRQKLMSSPKRNDLLIVGSYTGWP